MDTSALISLLGAAGSAVGALCAVAGGVYYLGKTKAEHVANQNAIKDLRTDVTRLEENAPDAEQIADLKTQVDRLRSVAADLGQSTRLADFRLKTIEDNTKAMADAAVAMAEFRGETRTVHKTFGDGIDRLSREISGMQRTLANIASGALGFKAGRSE